MPFKTDANQQTPAARWKESGLAESERLETREMPDELEEAILNSRRAQS